MCLPLSSNPLHYSLLQNNRTRFSHFELSQLLTIILIFGIFIERVGLSALFRFLVLQFFLEYLIFKSFPLFLGEDTAIAFLSYFHLRICDPDHWATPTVTA